MQSVLEIALMNAFAIVPLALLAFVIGRLFRRPALTHLMWVIVLVKLMTPPVWQVPLIDREYLLSSVQQLLPPAVKDLGRMIESGPLRGLAAISDTREMESAELPTMMSVGATGRPRTLADQNKIVAVAQNPLLAVVVAWVRSGVVRDLFASVLMAIWAIGGLVWFGYQGYRCIRFRRMLAEGTSAPAELQEFSDQFAKRLGLPRSPTVWLMPGVMSPMLWGNGYSNLLIFPERLLDRLDRESTGTLLTHELAHFRRRDHWVRVIELMVTGFFWWHPIVWWSRREIEAVEEECCDALVVKSDVASPKRYAEAILEAVDFLADVPMRLPALATGLSQFPFLRQRLTWIMRGPRRQDLGYCGRLLFLVLACNLPFQPTWLVANSSQSLTKSDLTDPLPWIELPSPSISTTGHVNDAGAVATTMNQVVDDASVPSRWLGLDVRSHSYDKRFIFLANPTTQILLDLETGRDFDLSPFDITSVAFSPNTNQFVTIDGDRFLRLWDAENCEVVRTWQVPGEKMKSVDISSDARWIATGSTDGVIRIWSANSQRPFREMPRELAPVNCVRFSPDSQLLAVATGRENSAQFGRIALFEVGSWSEQISMNWNSPAAAVAFRADGQSLTSGDWQGRIAKWNIQSGELMGLANARVELLAADEFSPNGSPLAEIDVPDLNPSSNWGDAPTEGQTPWFFQNWPLVKPASPIAPGKPMP